jgi:meso-butanediol dehydrogenase/(S,S)-butanediol dehydrogenase/diacetyl reductase
MKLGRVANKVAIVTGGGGKGIGSAISLLLAREGARLAVVDIDQNQGRKTAGLINRRGGQARFIRADVTINSNVFQMVDEVIRTWGQVDILVNSAGGGLGPARLEEIDEETLEQNLALNLKSAVFCTKAVLPHMISKEQGSVVYISSINAMLGGFGQTAYASAKAGLHSLVQTLTSDYSRHGLRFNVICPGSISESWTARIVMKRLEKRYPLKRLGEPADVAHAVLFLASDEASWITGVVLPVDGGITASGGIQRGK